ncbi:MAG: long-chain acyl-CoA synthetase, partial [Streblomastix strix]
DEESTKTALDEDGFFHTGDIGTWLPGNFLSDDGVTIADSLRIIDRRKNIFKLSQGEFICAERLEDVFIANVPIIKQIMVYGPSTASALVAFVVPDWDKLLSKEMDKETKSAQWSSGIVKKWQDESETIKIEQKDKEKKEETESDKEEKEQSSSQAQPTISKQRVDTDPNAEKFASPLSIHPDCKSYLLAVLKRAADSNPDKVRRFEIPKGIVLFSEEWNDYNGCMT